MKHIELHIGDTFETAAGYEEVTGIADSIAYTDSYEINPDGSVEKVSERRLTSAEVAQLMREADGHNYKVRLARAYVVFIKLWKEDRCISPIEYDTIDHFCTAEDFWTSVRDFEYEDGILVGSEADRIEIEIIDESGEILSEYKETITKSEKLYRHFDTGEIWTLGEIKESFESIDDLCEEYDSFEDFMDCLLALGREKIGGLIEI